MKESLQLRIPAPCGEDWARMQPTEKGRHCQSCCKTVVDFTEMSDAEIIRHLSQAGPHVCGRLMPDQLNRTLVPAPVQKNGRSGWAWVLASALMLAKGSDTGRSMKTGKIEVREPRADTDSTVTTGTIAHLGYEQPVIRKEGDTSTARRGLATRLVPDTNRVEMGKMAVAGADPIRPPGDTLPAVPPGVTKSEEPTALDGDIQVCVKTTRFTDILADTVKGIVADTLAALGWRPAPDLNIYPNPASRGGAMHLAWKTEPGQYQLTLMNMRGQLITERISAVGGAGQVDSWEIPASLAAGIYILRVVRQGGTAVCTREIMVR